MLVEFFEGELTESFVLFSNSLLLLEVSKKILIGLVVFEFNAFE